MGLDCSRVFRQAIVQLAESAGSIVVQPAGLSKENLGFGEGRTLFVDVLEELDGFTEVVRSSGGRDTGLDSAMEKILLSELHEEVGIQSDVEVKVVDGSLRLLDVKGKALIEETNSLILVTALAPFNHGFEECVLGSFAL